MNPSEKKLLAAKMDYAFRHAGGNPHDRRTDWFAAIDVVLNEYDLVKKDNYGVRK